METVREMESRLWLSFYYRTCTSGYHSDLNLLGPIVYLKLPGQSMIIIGSHKVAEDLLERRSSKYSDRPRFIVANNLIAGNLAIMLHSPDERKVNPISDFEISHNGKFLIWT